MNNVLLFESNNINISIKFNQTNNSFLNYFKSKDSLCRTLRKNILSSFFCAITDATVRCYLSKNKYWFLKNFCQIKFLMKAAKSHAKFPMKMKSFDESAKINCDPNWLYFTDYSLGL